MPASTTVTGMVLSAMPVGEYDKRLVILTKEFGKITAFAKGARKPNSALLACSGSLAFGEFSLYVGRSSYSIVAADISNYFGEIRNDFERLCYGMYYCEFADYITRENNDEIEILKLLYQTLRALEKKTIEHELIRAIFELKIISLNGEAPQVFQCVKCGKDEQHLKYFSNTLGGMLCLNCKSCDKSSIEIETSTLYTIQYIISKEVEKLYTFRVSDQVLRELKRLMSLYLYYHVDYTFKSLDMLN